MDDDTHPSQAKIRLELERLRTENRRLRGLLGLDGQGHEALLVHGQPAALLRPVRPDDAGLDLADAGEQEIIEFVRTRRERTGGARQQKAAG